MFEFISMLNCSLQCVFIFYFTNVSDENFRKFHILQRKQEYKQNCVESNEFGTYVASSINIKHTDFNDNDIEINI